MLEATDISFGYSNSRSKQQLYNGISIQIKPLERVALTAPSGFGKTTLCKLLSGYEVPDSGEISVDGTPLEALTANASKACPVQLIGQHPEYAIDPYMRMRDVLEEALPSEHSHGIDTQKERSTEQGQQNQQLERILDRLDIQADWMSRLPHELSGGQLQRFCIARALLTQPRYLIADEISTMLDAVTQARIWNFLLEEIERQEMGLVFVTHSPALRDLIATRIIKLG